MQLTNLGDLFRKKREELGKTQFDIAELAKIDAKHYGRIERNECINPELITFLQICKALKTSPLQILNELLNKF